MDYHYLLLFINCISLCFSAKFEGCDVVVDSSVCIKNGESVLLPSARRHGRVLHYRFDENVALDSSGFGNHGVGKVVGHSGFGGVGSSAYFRKNFIYLRDVQDLRAQEFSLLFFVYLLSDDESLANAQKVNEFCPIVHKGIRNPALSECAPEIAINPKDGRVRVLISVESNHTVEIDSNCRLQPHQWYHLAVVKDKAAVTLYINGNSSTLNVNACVGILDCVYPSKAYVRFNPLPLFIGASPYIGMCDMPILLDEFSFYAKAVGRDEIQAEASAALGGIEPSYITIGCTNCGKQEAMRSCPQGYHLCNKFELYTGGYGLALRLSIPSNTVMAAASAEPSSGVALCCANLQG
ncbi:uncharacterized protein BXIN_2306 [Babesia sp. Xinjiang]|uniref:uncharacterized protein n=1 Tax=Babesia sp. Xinjiang TaxID=462227 RepID=UPI000A24FDCA|nr:uncharacterized protein BXIN_2306 [Babesia sp. Xinjiang]ORM40765.1 hypothetical protein BXIN_2306 [Babesia sp. Xinjiang]